MIFSLVDKFNKIKYRIMRINCLQLSPPRLHHEVQLALTP
jgi:hypothetical protein